jgi:hypothetical protein
MDSLITAAARALATGNPLNALNFIALRDDAPALALRGIAMAQLGDLSRAKTLLRRAARVFSPREAVASARCVNHRVLVFEEHGEKSYCIHEVHYGKRRWRTRNGDVKEAWVVQAITNHCQGVARRMAVRVRQLGAEARRAELERAIDESFWFHRSLDRKIGDLPCVFDHRCHAGARKQQYGPSS